VSNSSQIVIYIAAIASKNRYQLVELPLGGCSNLCHWAIDGLRDVAAAGPFFVRGLEYQPSPSRRQHSRTPAEKLSVWSSKILAWSSKI